ncbi:hypothetical protein [Aridibaculum aurantiacum]|uniref:hypothetical protein n=1 Tax=Aridibaculum aurantiacum TaxID=2810307 RepID=UPI001A97A6FD|nr:hypothetical protein [Aridibaculum aurantiacum]
MKFICTLLFSLLIISANAGAQNLTGIWKGHFVQKSFGYYEDRYKFEIQVEQLANNALNGVTYSYKTTVFYGKADLKGIYTKKTNNIVFNETKLLEVKIGDQSQPCLMTCYLEYGKMGSLETLTGTYTSRNLKNGTDCGNGQVYLEKVKESDFHKEDFLVKRENELKRRQNAQNNTAKAPPTRATPKVPQQSVQPKGIKPGAEENIVSKDNRTNRQNEINKGILPPPTEELVQAPPTERAPIQKPDVIRKRTNELAKKVIISSKEFKIDLYDNGEIDGDTISVYHNNKLIVSKKLLTHKPISLNIKVDENETHHEFVMIAENLGSIPPNTALMIITAGGKRHELHITSTEQKNAVVVIEYKPDN